MHIYNAAGQCNNKHLIIIIVEYLINYHEMEEESKTMSLNAKTVATQCSDIVTQCSVTFLELHKSHLSSLI